MKLAAMLKKYREGRIHKKERAAGQISYSGMAAAACGSARMMFVVSEGRELDNGNDLTQLLICVDKYDTKKQWESRKQIHDQV